jgi:hypothetical protein
MWAEEDGQAFVNHIFPGLWPMEFGYSERTQRQWYERIPKAGVLLWKKSIILSALGPTSIEATEQFDKCLDEMNGHRKNLVVQCRGFFNKFIIMKPWTVTE